VRCGKCQRRIGAGDYPVIETAVAPDLAFRPAPEQKPRLSTVHTNPQATRQVRPTQQPLFAYREPQKVLELPGASPARARSESSQSRPRAKTGETRRLLEGQGAFDFGAPAPPAQPFRKETSRRNVFPVAPLSVRAVAALIDAAIVFAFTAGLIGFIRVLLNELAGYSLPLTSAYAPYALVALLSVGICYKLIWCLFCQPTIGLQQVGLRVVSFTGQLPSLSQCIARILSGYLSFGSLCMGLAWAAVDDEQLTWHDHISQTYLALDRNE
jgi:uncharacterized RDD family membrane protein YckC